MNRRSGKAQLDAMIEASREIMRRNRLWAESSRHLSRKMVEDARLNGFHPWDDPKNAIVKSPRLVAESEMLWRCDDCNQVFAPPSESLGLLTAGERSDIARAWFQKHIHEQHADEDSVKAALGGWERSPYKQSA